MVPNLETGASAGMALAWPGREPVPAARHERFDACFKEHYARVLAYGVRRLPGRAAAEDVAAETFLVAWRRLEDIPDDPLLWRLGIARHLILNERRSSRRRDRLASRIGAQPSDADYSGPQSRPGSAEVMRALGWLVERDREVLLLSTWDGLDHRRAAAVLGCTRGAFAVRLHRARARLASSSGDCLPQRTGYQTFVDRQSRRSPVQVKWSIACP